MIVLVDGIVLAAGLAHALAAYLYFSRTRISLVAPLAWLAATAGCLVVARETPLIGYGLFALVVVAWTAWWVGMRPSAHSNWVEENRHQATGQIIGDALTVTHVRAFEWVDKRTFTPAWIERHYDLSRLVGMDLFVCTWGDPRIAHTMVSFDFGDTHPLCFSIETRREVGERWTALAGFMRSYELIVIAGEERDLVRSRVNIRGETVRLYRIVSDDAGRRKILARYVAQMNRLATRPRFYNTIFSNCTTEIAAIVSAAGHRFPLDWRLLVSGRVASYLYDRALIDTSKPFADIERDADIAERARAADTDPAFARRIRGAAMLPIEARAGVSRTHGAVS